MTDIGDFSQATQNMVDRNINRPFRDAVPKLERWFDTTGGLTRNRLVFFERYWGEEGPTKITRFEYEDRYQQLQARYLRRHPSHKVVLDKKGRILIRNKKGQFVTHEKFFKELYKKKK